MVNGFRYYRALESVSIESAMSTVLTIYPCQIWVHQLSKEEKIQKGLITKYSACFWPGRNTSHTSGTLLTTGTVDQRPLQSDTRQRSLARQCRVHKVANLLPNWQPMQLTKHKSDVVLRLTSTQDKACSHILDWLWSRKQTICDTRQHWVAIVEKAGDECIDYYFCS